MQPEASEAPELRVALRQCELHDAKCFEARFALATACVAAKETAADGVAMYKQSADQGDPEAMCALGLCYANGNGIDQDDKKASEVPPSLFESIVLSGTSARRFAATRTRGTSSV